MDLPANRPRVARKKFWCRFLKRTVRYESHLVTISAKRFQKSPAKCPAFSCHFLPSMLCVPAPCGGNGLYARAWATSGQAHPVRQSVTKAPTYSAVPRLLLGLQYLILLMMLFYLSTCVHALPAHSDTLLHCS